VSSRRPRRGRRFLGAGLAVLVVAGGAAGYLLTRSSGGQAGQVQYTFTTARRGELRQTVDAQFTMTRSRQTQLRAPAAGVVTKLHLSQGQALPALEPLLEVDGAAVYGIASATPFYRDLVEGDTGDDVEALQAALAAAGYDPGGDFGSQTATALEDWQEAQGLDVTGRLPLADFVSFPPGSIVLDLPIAVGDRLAAGGNLATVGGSRDLIAQADVAQADVVRLEVGQGADLTFDALSGGQVSAKVATIALEAETQSANAVRGLPYTVIGVLRSQGGAGFVNPDDDLLVPLDTLAGRVTSSDPPVNQLRVAAAPGAVGTFGDTVASALRASHGLSGDESNDFLIINPNSLIQAQQQSSSNFTRRSPPSPPSAWWSAASASPT
jgi:peptidoglycan hydrolase-like protein with peptidoglycan-binding domain